MAGAVLVVPVPTGALRGSITPQALVGLDAWQAGLGSEDTEDKAEEDTKVAEAMATVVVMEGSCLQGLLISNNKEVATTVATTKEVTHSMVIEAQQ